MSVVAPPLTLRPPRPSDRGRVAEIVRATGVFRPSELDIALEVFDGAVQQPGADYHALGAYDDGGWLIGFACYGPTPGTAATWDLYWIAVDPGTHRRGVGRALMAACEQAIVDAGGRLVVVETSSRPDYGPTRAFYQALAYGATARIPDFYAPDDALVVYTKRLVPSRRERPHG
ncbi:MAG: GNAT family N-acetyltransferase [Gemmatimonadetes bacterium]|nr:GNAT family N-acetyltransferase [Gemmatimonadota bacterium]